MKLTKISVQGLYGGLKHEIPLGSGGVTFIHGPNGSGKTTVLRLVHALLSRDFHSLRTIDFKGLEVTYADGHSLLVSRSVAPATSGLLVEDEDEDEDEDENEDEDEDEEDILRAAVDIKISLLNEKREVQEEFEYSRQLQNTSMASADFPLSSISRRLPFLMRMAANRWLDQQTANILTFEGVIAKYGDMLNHGDDFKWPVWLSARFEQAHIGFVRTQRLINISSIVKGGRTRERKEPRDVVKIYSNQIKDTIAKKLAESAIQSQARDRSFPIRLINKEFVKDVPQEQFLETYRSTEERAQNLMSVGLLDQAASIPLPQRVLTSHERDVLALYLSDFNDKLDAFTDLQKKIEAFVDIVGTKLRRKRFVVDRKKGFFFETSDSPPRKLSVTDLSSGEQHQIVLFYELIFASAGIDLFLIDEPEISLHVEWQRAFISDIEKVRALTGATFLIATHSPQIINNRRDLAVPLDGGVPE